MYIISTAATTLQPLFYCEHGDLYDQIPTEVLCVTAIIALNTDSADIPLGCCMSMAVR